MDFVGTGKRLQPGDIGNAARSIGIPTAAMLAFVEIESAGVGFDNKNRLIILFEPHKFYANLGPGPKRDRAVAMGLAYKSWGEQPYPKGYDARYNQLSQAITIDFEKGLFSASWALPQILGSNYHLAGYNGVDMMVEGFLISEGEQVKGMAEFLLNADIVPKILKAIQTGNWVPVAEAYNGKLQARNDYAGKLKRSFDKHSKGETMTLPTQAVGDVLALGMKGEAVMNFQRDLIALGFDIGTAGADGRFGDKTELAVRAFQKANGLDIDGKVGRNTLKAIAAAVAKLQEPAKEPEHTWPGQEPKAEGKNRFLGYYILAALAAMVAGGAFLFFG